MTTIQVNEKTKAGKALIETARVMAEKHKGIEFIQDGDSDDQALLSRMLEARKSGTVERENVIETLKSIKFLELSDFSFKETQDLLKDFKGSFSDEVIDERRTAL